MVTTKIPAILIKNPARIISIILNLLAPYTIAFGGVATGSMNAQLAARTTGTVSTSGAMPIATATGPAARERGSRRQVVAWSWAHT